METLSITKAQGRSISNYRRMGIDIDLLDEDIVKITQSCILNGYILNQKELVERAKEVFPDAKVIPLVYSLDVATIDLEWIESKMNEFGIKRNDIIKQMALDKSTLSSMFNGDRGLTKSQRAAFYFYFLTYELNRDFRRSEDQGFYEANSFNVDRQFSELFNEAIRIITHGTNRVIKSIRIEGDAIRIDIIERNNSMEYIGGLTLPIAETYQMFKANDLKNYLNGAIVLYK